MSTGYWDDTEREEGTLTRVDPESGGWYSVTSSTGWSCGVSAEYGVAPKVGDRFVTWGGIGHTIRGMAINDRVLFYRTPAEQDVENKKALEKHNAERIAEYEGKRNDFEQRVLALRPPLRERIERFREFRGDEWRWKFESYELMCCEQAERLVGHFATTDALKAFHALDYEGQKAAFPEMDEGHSGNSWGFSQRLAHLLIEHPAMLWQEHGALCPLVGCEDYGCYASRIKEEPARG